MVGAAFEIVDNDIKRISLFLFKSNGKRDHTITREEEKLVFDSTDYETFKEKGKSIIHWLPMDSDLPTVDVLMPDNTIVTGFAEVGVKNLKVGDVVQFERFGFCRLDKIEDSKLIFWYGHN